MAQTLVSNLRSVRLPRYGVDGFGELSTQNFSKNVAISGRMYVDFLNTRRGWRISFDVLTRAEYESILEIYNDQFTDGQFLLFYDDDLGISEVPVFLNMPQERTIKWSNEATMKVEIVLEKRDADDI